MARYIDADKLIKKVFPYDVIDKKSYTINAKTIFEAINNAPTEDVAEAVRCKDCKHRNPNCYKCMRDNLWHGSDDFCSYGERITK